MLHQGLLPAMITYSAWISACEKGAMPQSAVQLLETMLHQGLLPDVITYNALISACEKGALPQRALELFETMLHQGLLPDVITYNALIQCFASTVHIEAGFVSLARAEASEVLLQSGKDCYVMVRTLLEACRAAGDSEGASRLQAVVERFGLIAEVPVAVAIFQGSEWRCENGVNGDGVGDARMLWTELRRQTAYAPHLLALPWIFVKSRTHKEQAGSLQLHAEKKALARLLACGEDDLKVSINFNACIDCHEWFKSSSLLLDCRIQLRQPGMVHTFTQGWCSCSDRWRWESRLAAKARSTPLLADCVHA